MKNVSVYRKAHVQLLVLLLLHKQIQIIILHCLCIFLFPCLTFDVLLLVIGLVECFCKNLLLFKDADASVIGESV